MLERYNLNPTGKRTINGYVRCTWNYKLTCSHKETGTTHLWKVLKH